MVEIDVGLLCSCAAYTNVSDKYSASMFRVEVVYISLHSPPPPSGLRQPLNVVCDVTDAEMCAYAPVGGGGEEEDR